MGTLGLDPSCGILQRSTFLLNTHIIGQHWYDQKKNIGHEVGSDTPVSTIKFKYFPMQKNIDQSKLIQILNFLILAC